METALSEQRDKDNNGADCSQNPCRRVFQCLGMLRSLHGLPPAPGSSTNSTKMGWEQTIFVKVNDWDLSVDACVALGIEGRITEGVACGRCIVLTCVRLDQSIDLFGARQSKGHQIFVMAGFDRKPVQLSSRWFMVVNLVGQDDQICCGGRSYLSMDAGISIRMVDLLKAMIFTFFMRREEEMVHMSTTVTCQLFLDSF
ncbi:hypothetical protein ZIOFF_070267 [Zingiber officinale]|uniref:Uncharacterized protein n=1 Tax=Zingiber officinale TaxID=94328 RepID=A0A8J5EVB2_ZINOF|nr:hypothetical protein ZIOFF_070267 [Zingiber officinale]